MLNVVLFYARDFASSEIDVIKMNKCIIGETKSVFLGFFLFFVFVFCFLFFVCLFVLRPISLPRYFYLWR